MKRILPFVVLAAVAIASMLSCQQELAEIHVSSISFTESKVELTVGEQQSLEVTISPDNATNKKISWSSSRESVATVTPNGIVEAVSIGTAFITATSEDNGVNATCEITVKKAISVTGIALNKTSLSLAEGEEFTLEATVTPNNATNKEISWASDNEAVATVSAVGVVKAIKAGTANITATSDDSGVNATCELTVKEKAISVTGIALNKTSLSLAEGEEFTLEATVTPDNATNKEITWASDNEAVVTVSSEGVVKALRAGTASITATTVDQGKTASCTITVAEKMGAVTGEATNISCRNARLSGKANISQNTSTNLSFGVLYSTSSGIVIGSAKQLEAKEFDAENCFTVDSGVLEPGTTYYYRTYIIQNDEVEYGQTKSFNTLALSSMIQTLDASYVVPKEATLNAMLDLTDCKYSSIEYGFELTPEGGQVKTLTANNLSDKAFSYHDETLVKNTEYSYTAYVKLDDILYKAEPKTFTTASIQASVTAEASDVQYHSATIFGRLDVQSEGSFSKSAVLYYSASESTLDGLKSNGTRKTLTLGADGSYTAALSSLYSSTSYNYVVVAKVDGVEFVSAIGNFLTPALPSEPLVDLGLSVKWASCNLGASKLTECGGYYQWAGTKDVSDTSINLYWDNCPYHTGSSSSTGWTKYNTKSSYGTVDNKTVLESMDDAAAVALGGKWRLPTDEEWTELRNTDNCSWTWASIDGVGGYKVQSKKSGYTDKWIFLPAAGYRGLDDLDDVGAYGSYWSSSLDTDYPSFAYGMDFDSGNFGRHDGYRYYGQSVRPVSE